MTRRSLPTIERLRELFEYNPDTGVLAWKKAGSSRAPAGRVAGSFDQDGYIKLGVDRCTLRAHRVAWAIFYGNWPSKPLDHINGNRTDNRISNLREADAFQNAWNSPASHGVAKLRGAVAAPDGRFYSRIRVDGKLKQLGTFNEALDAHRAYVAASIKYRGEFSAFHSKRAAQKGTP